MLFTYYINFLADFLLTAIFVAKHIKKKYRKSMIGIRDG